MKITLNPSPLHLITSLSRPVTFFLYFCKNFVLPKILIIRFSSIGDIVLTTPVIRCISKQIKDSEIHFLTKKAFHPVLKANPHLHKIHLLEKGLNEIIPQLVKENFDFVIDLHNNLRSSLVKFKLKSPSRSFDKLNFEKWLLVNFKINKMPGVHIVDRYMKAAASLGIVNDGKGLDYFIPNEEEIDLQSLPETHRNGYLGFVIGGQHATKQLPVDKIISICNKINMPIILLGGKEDVSAGEKIAAFAGREKIYNACGKYSINQSASLVKQAVKIITHDTGLMHIAAALKKDIISIWGNTVPEFGMYPYMAGNNSFISEVKGLPCRPCSKIGYSRCPKKHFYCMNLIDETAIADAVNLGN
jgi:ADP-heptose:LPS heptosyltransferase